MDILQRIHHACGVVEIPQGGWPVGVGFQVDDHRRRTARADIDPTTRQTQVMGWVTGGKRHGPIKTVKRGSHEGRRENQPPVRRDGAARCDDCF